MRKKILIIGHKRHGKDTTAEMLRDQFGFSFKSSSQAASEIFIYNVLKELYGYQTPEECFEDRDNHREEWYKLICDFNKEDKSALAKVIMARNDIYVGMRDDRECGVCIREGIFDLVIGVFDPRKELESEESMKINIWEQSDIILSNAGTLDDLKRKVLKLKPLLFTPLRGITIPAEDATNIMKGLTKAKNFLNSVQQAVAENPDNALLGNHIRQLINN
jgi:hypothetical protein